MSYQLVLGGNPIQVLNSSTGSIYSIGDGGSANYNFRYLRFYILANAGGTATQFSMLQFYSNDNTIYQYPLEMTAGSTFDVYGTENFEKTLKSDQPSIKDGKLFCGAGGKLCTSFTGGTSEYCWIDLGVNNSINLRYFNNLRWFASNDTYHTDGNYDTSMKIGKRNITSYRLDVSTDNSNWRTVSSEKNIVPIVNPADYTSTKSYGFDRDNPPNYGLVHCGKIKVY